MSFFKDLKKTTKISSQLKQEEQRMSNLDWKGLKEHLVNAHEHYFEREAYEMVQVVEMLDGKLFEKMMNTFSDNKFGLKLEEISYRMFWLGFTVGCGIVEEGFPTEERKLLYEKKECESEVEMLLKSKGLQAEFLLKSFSRLIETIFNHGVEHGERPDFMEFRPRRVYG